MEVRLFMFRIYSIVGSLFWNDILHNHNEDMSSLDGIMNGGPKYV